ncbi:hypothetical protein FF1_009098 [Malus domestica]
MLARFILSQKYGTGIAISANSQIAQYARLGQIEKARRVFDQMPDKNIVSWNSMVGGYFQMMLGGMIQEGRIDDARRLYDMMPKKDVVARTNMIGGYFQIDRLAEACEIFYEMPHRNVVSCTTMVSRNLFQAMPIKSVVACSAMILGYGENGEVAKAREVFDNMRDRDERTWRAMIKFYERKGFELEALDLFALMQREGIRLNFPSLISVLSVCGSLANHDHGRQIHAQLAKQVFDRFSAKDIVMWNSMITGYAQHGLGDKALQVFEEMCSLSIAADEITFVGILSACSYRGKGRWHDVAELRENMRARSHSQVTWL